MEVVALSIGEIWLRWVWPILQLVIGLGLVIFVHELGHFLAAKWAGIKVEEFALGFGKRLWSRRRGETEYRINLLPLGGYVKMLGQDDFRPALAADADPRSWHSAAVGRRLVVLSAGVAMNVVFAALLFIAVGLVGIHFPASVVGGAAPDYPASDVEIAWEDAPGAAATQAAAASRPSVTRGLRPGDRITRIDDTQITRLDKLRFKAILAKPDSVFTIRVERDFDGRTRVGTARIGVMPVRGGPGGTRLTFGIAPARDIVFGEIDGPQDDPFRDGDRVVAINGRAVRHYWDIPAIAETLDGSPVAVTVQRGDERLDVRVQPELTGGKLADMIDHEGSRLYGTILRRNSDEVVLRLEDGSERTFKRPDVTVGKDELLDILGMTPRRKILEVAPGSPAAKAGLLAGDIVARYGDRGVPTLRRFLDINDKVVDTGTDIVVIRDGKTLDPIRIVPKKHTDRVLVGITQVTDLASTVVAGVRPGSAAAAAGVQAGDVIEQVNGRKVRGWIDVFTALKGLAGREITLSYARGQARHTRSAGTLSQDAFDPGDYQFALFIGPRPFQELTVRVVKPNPLAAVAWGLGETADFILMTYGTLRGWLSGTLSGRQLSGPVGIVGAGVQVARRSPITFVYLMAIIGVSLAVINFLPLPVLDGGLVVLVLIEKIRGRPVPLKVQAAIQIVGLVLIVSVFVALTWSDISKWIWRSW